MFFNTYFKFFSQFDTPDNFEHLAQQANRTHQPQHAQHAPHAPYTAPHYPAAQNGYPPLPQYHPPYLQNGLQRFPTFSNLLGRLQSLICSKYSPIIDRLTNEVMHARYGGTFRPTYAQPMFHSAAAGGNAPHYQPPASTPIEINGEHLAPVYANHPDQHGTWHGELHSPATSQRYDVLHNSAQNIHQIASRFAPFDQRGTVSRGVLDITRGLEWAELKNHDFDLHAARSAWSKPDENGRRHRWQVNLKNDYAEMQAWDKDTEEPSGARSSWIPIDKKQVPLPPAYA